MKRIALFMIALGVLNLIKTNAQTQQGKIMVGLSSSLGISVPGSDLMSFGYSSGNDETVRSFNLTPKIGYLINDNVALGLDISLYNTRIAYKGSMSDLSSTTSLAGVGPYFRFYFPLGRVLPFVEVSGVYGKIIYSMDNSGDYRSSFFTFSGFGGVAFPISDKVTFDVMAGGCYTEAGLNSSNSSGSSSGSTSLGLKLGFTVFLGK